MLLLMVLLLKLLGNWTYTTLVILTLIVHLPLLFLSFFHDACVSGDQYIGEWRQGHKHGKGVLRFANGD